MRRNIDVYLEDISQSVEKIEEYIADLTEDQFSRNIQIQDAVLRRLAIIGEAVKHLPKEFREKHKEIPWNQIAGARDIFVHEYFGVKLERIWITLKEDLPKLKTEIQKIKTQRN